VSVDYDASGQFHRVRGQGARRSGAAPPDHPLPVRGRLDVVSARVSTLGELVVDAFYIREAGGEKVTDQARLDEVTAVIWASLTA